MNAALPRFLKSAYRKEPIPSFLITIGLVDAVIGGLDERWLLFTFGLGTVGIAIALRLWLLYSRRSEEPSQPVAQHYLPYSSSSQELPPLMISKKKPPR